MISKEINVLHWALISKEYGEQIDVCSEIFREHSRAVSQYTP